MTRPVLPQHPKDLEINEAGDGFIVYDSARDRVHYLNHTAALVLELSTGRLGIPEIATWISRAYSLEEPPLDDVERLVDELVAEGLLFEGGPASEGEAESSTEEPKPVTGEEQRLPRADSALPPEDPYVTR